MQALKLYRLDNQRYPMTEQGLQRCRPSRPRPGSAQLEGGGTSSAAEGPGAILTIT